MYFKTVNCFSAMKSIIWFQWTNKQTLIKHNNVSFICESWKTSYSKIKQKNSWIFTYLFFSPCGKTLGASGSLRLFFACASASSSHACNIGFNAIMLLCDKVRLSNLHIVLWDSAPTPGNFKLARAFPTSACVTPSFVVNKGL